MTGPCACGTRASPPATPILPTGSAPRASPVPGRPGHERGDPGQNLHSGKGRRSGVDTGRSSHPCRAGRVAHGEGIHMTDFGALTASERLYDEIDTLEGRSNVDIEKHLRRSEVKAAQAQVWLTLARDLSRQGDRYGSSGA